MPSPHLESSDLPHPSGHPPMSTVGAPGPVIVPTGSGAGSLHVMTVSPTLAAGLLLISTVALPFTIVPWFVGGIWKGPGPAGMWGGLLTTVLPSTAAGAPPIITFVLTPPVMVPTKGCGNGVGTGPPGDGTMMM